MAATKEFIEPELVRYEERLADITADNHQTGYNNSPDDIVE